MDDQPVLNQAQIGDLRGIDAGKGAVLSRLVGRFVEGLDARTALIAACVDDGRMPDLVIAAHSLKGAAGNLGAARLAAIASRLEVAGREHDGPQAAALVSVLRVESDTARAALLATVRNGA